MKRIILALALLVALAAPARADILDAEIQINYNPDADDAIRNLIDLGGATAAMTCPLAQANLYLWVGFELPITNQVLVGTRTLGPIQGLMPPVITTIACHYSWHPNMQIAAAGQWWRVVINPICPSGVTAGQPVYDIWQYGTARFWRNVNGPFLAKAWWAGKLQSCGGSVDQYYNPAWNSFCLLRSHPITGPFQKCFTWAWPGGL